MLTSEYRANYLEPPVVRDGNIVEAGNRSNNAEGAN